MAIQSCKTSYYIIQFDEANQSTGSQLAAYLCTHADNDFELMQKWFPGVPIPQIPLLVTIHPTISPNQWGAATLTNFNVDIYVPNRVDIINANTIRWLLVGEVTEILMWNQNKGWHGNLHGGKNEGTVGEGLSLFLQQQFAQINNLQVNYPNSFFANYWMKSSTIYINPITFHPTVKPYRPTENLSCLSSTHLPSYSCPTVDFDNRDAPNGSFVYAGFYFLFIYYLKDQLNKIIPQIIDAGPKNTGSITEVYRNLTGHTNDPFPSFKQLINQVYPGTTPIPDNLYSPFPINPYIIIDPGIYHP